MKPILSFTIVAVVGLASAVGADQEPFEGQVMNLKSVPIHQARVELYRLDDPALRVTTVTDENGAFSLPLRDLLPPRPNGLGQNHPNPFNPSTLIPFEIAKAGHVRLDVYNIVGQRVVTLVDEERPAGLHRVRWNGTDATGRGVATGIYIYRLSTGEWQDTRKLTLLDGSLGHRSGGAVNVRVEEAPRFGVKVSSEAIVPATFTWSPEMGALVAEVRSLDNLHLSEVDDPETAANPFSGTSLASIIQVVSGN